MEPFSFFRTVFSVKRMGDSAFLWEGGITFLYYMTGTDRLCDEGPGQDDEGQVGTQRRGRSMDGGYNCARFPTAQLLKIQVWTPLSLPFSCWNHDTLPGIGVCNGKVLISVDTTQAPYPRIDRCRPKLSDAYWSSYKNADDFLHTRRRRLSTYKLIDFWLSILMHQTITTPGVLGLSCLLLSLPLFPMLPPISNHL
jgi:hypothetical protein